MERRADKLKFARCALYHVAHAHFPMLVWVVELVHSWSWPVRCNHRDIYY